MQKTDNSAEIMSKKVTLIVVRLEGHLLVCYRVVFFYRVLFISTI